MSIIKRITDSYREYRAWKWVGTVEGACLELDADGQRKWNKSTYWALYVRGDGKRKIETFGNPQRDYSQACRVAHAQVQARLHNGPLPKLYESPEQETPPKQKAKLLVFTGGKGAA